MNYIWKRQLAKKTSTKHENQKPRVLCGSSQQEQDFMNKTKSTSNRQIISFKKKLPLF